MGTDHQSHNPFSNHGLLVQASFRLPALPGTQVGFAKLGFFIKNFRPYQRGGAGGVGILFQTLKLLPE